MKHLSASSLYSSLALFFFHCLSEMNSSGCATAPCPPSFIEALKALFPTVSSLYTSPLTFPWYASVFWRLAHCGALTGSVEQWSPGESSLLFLCLFQCSFKDQLLRNSHIWTYIILSKETCYLFGTNLHICVQKLTRMMSRYLRS